MVVLSAEDAELAVEAGAAGILVSNLGGRALDTVPATVSLARFHNISKCYAGILIHEV